MSTNPCAVWDALNERQRTYLRALYKCDQSTEAARRERAAGGLWDRTPAAEWRWQMYGPTAPPSQLYQLLHKACQVDPGTGSTWQALEKRRLVLWRSAPDAFGVPLLQVQMTPHGREVVRAATSAQQPPRPPKGQLRERHDQDNRSYSSIGFDMARLSRILTIPRLRRRVARTRRGGRAPGGGVGSAGPGAQQYEQTATARLQKAEARAVQWEATARRATAQALVAEEEAGAIIRRVALQQHAAARSAPEYFDDLAGVCRVCNQPVPDAPARRRDGLRVCAEDACRQEARRRDHAAKQRQQRARWRMRREHERTLAG